jgi:ZPR1-related zinc finger protein
MSTEKRNSETIYSFKCPSCENGTIDIIRSVYDLPDGDKMLILKFECDICNFHKNDVIPLTTKMDPGVMTLKVTTEEDLKSKIYRSPIGKLEIPELELIVEPGPRADFYYTNVEGILYRFESAVSIYRKNLEEKDPETPEIDNILDNLRKALEGKFNFTLKITDSEGGSYIIPQDKSKYKFEKFESKKSE